MSKRSAEVSEENVSSKKQKVENMSVRRFFVGGNWKCNGTVALIGELTAGLSKGSVPADVDAVVCPTYIHLAETQRALSATSFHVASQNCSASKTGAFTGEIAASQLVDFGIEWVVLGHSERRAIYGESNETVGSKVAIAQENGLSVIACIGETLAQREAGNLESVLTAQMSAIIANVKSWTDVVIAYEPVWAIGTGVVASPQQAQDAHKFLRTLLASKVSAHVAATTRIIYGGSVKPKNCVELAGNADIDGFLVGGASLKAPDFLAILQANAGQLSKL
jgi:triosephosphate isomerase